MNLDSTTRKLALAASFGNTYSVSELNRIRSHRPFLLRTGEVAVSKAIRPLIPGSILLGNNRYQFMASGGEQFVFAGHDEVVKVNFQTFTFDEAKAEQAAQKFTDLYGAAQPHLGEHQLATQFDYRRFKHGLFAVVALQPRLQPLLEFEDINHLIRSCTDREHMDRLENLYSSLIDLYQNTSMLMDLNGRKNIVVHDEGAREELTIIDTVPIPSKDQDYVHTGNTKSIGMLIAEKMFAISSAVSKHLKSAESRVAVAH